MQESSQGRLQILVTDDGCGMTPEQLADLREKLSNPQETGGIGLRNIVNRLRLFYGDRYEIDIRSTPGEGTSVRILIPDSVSEEKEEPAAAGVLQ